jgi:PAS domain S-box-containing protein
VTTSGSKGRLADDLVKELAALQGQRDRGFEDDLGELRHLAHELRVHQAELELQNQQLIEMQGLLEQSRARYVELYDNAPVGYLTLDHAGVIGDINLTAAGLLGRERASLIATNIRQHVGRQDRRRVDALLRDCFGHGRRASIEVVLPARIVEMVAVPVRGLEGPVVSCRMALNDITERRQADHEREALLERAQEARVHAERASRVKEDFLAVVSHELRAPMAPMRMWMKVLRDRADDAGTRARAIDVLETCVKAQVKLIDDLVDVVRSAKGKLQVERQPLELAPLLERVVAVAEPSAAAKRISLRVLRDGDGGDLQLLADADRLQQAIGNVLSNAVKFTGDDGQVTVRLGARDGRAVVEVQDDGEGIDPELLPHLFEPFRQQDSTAVRSHGGLGLGLAIARDLVMLHEGTIAAASGGPGQGSTFTIELPLLLPGASSGAGPARAVIDDDPDTREALEAALVIFGAEVAAAPSAAEARAALARGEVDVVVCDVAMPREDGCTFVRKLRAAEPGGAVARLPVVALSAHAGPEHRARALDAGFDRYLLKPIDADELAGELAHVLGRTGAGAAE